MDRSQAADADTVMRGAPHVLLVRSDSAGDVLLTGPAVRAVAARAGRVTFLCGPRGHEAARLLPGVDEVVVEHVAWIDAEPRPVDRPSVTALVDRLRASSPDEAIVFTSFHQSPLPMALVLRMAGFRRIAAVSVDYPGSLLDVRLRVPEDVPDDIHEVERALRLAAAAGYHLPDGDSGGLAVRPVAGRIDVPPPEPPYVVVHPGASVPARAWDPQANAALVRLLAEAGRRVVVTGSPDEAALTAMVAGGLPGVSDLGGRTDLAGLARVLAAADVVVVGNTGPAHLAAATRTPVVSLFAPTVPAARWRPWAVPHVLLGDQSIACAGCRARRCPVDGHPCLAAVRPEDALAAVLRLSPAPGERTPLHGLVRMG